MNREKLEQIWSEPDNWTWGVIYRSKEDPRVIVPRRWKWGGWTLNFDHPHAWLTGIFAMLVAVGPALIALALGVRGIWRLSVIFLSILMLIVWSHWESTRYN